MHGFVQRYAAAAVASLERGTGRIHLQDSAALRRWDTVKPMSDPNHVPDGFVLVSRTSPFLDLLGGLYVLDANEGPVYGLRVLPEHANNREGVHGGILMTMADLVLGYTTAFSTDPPMRLTTANLNIDLVGRAKIGDWVEGRADIVRTGRSLAFANAYLTVGDKRIARASSVLAVAATTPDSQSSQG